MCVMKPIRKCNGFIKADLLFASQVPSERSWPSGLQHVSRGPWQCLLLRNRRLVWTDQRAERGALIITHSLHVFLSPCHSSQCNVNYLFSETQFAWLTFAPVIIIFLLWLSKILCDYVCWLYFLFFFLGDWAAFDEPRAVPEGGDHPA